LTVFASLLRRRDIRYHEQSRMMSRGRRSGRRSISDVRKLGTAGSNAGRACQPERQIQRYGYRQLISLTYRDKEGSITTPSERFIACAHEFLLDEYLPKIERCLERLNDEQIWWRANEESNSIGNLVLHLCGNARQWIVSGVGGESDARARDAEFAQRKVIARDELVALLRSTLTDVGRVVKALDTATLLERRTIQGSDVDVLQAIFHVTEHFSMHTGQIFLLTKLLTATDLRFYDFEAGAPVERWHSGPSDSS
jgi:uncharacterized damage-inducible protein DinB